MHYRIVGLHPNILYNENLLGLRKELEYRKEKYVSTETITGLAEAVFTFEKKILMQKQETDICTKFAPPYSILFMGELDEEIIRVSEFEPYLWRRHIDEIFILW